MAAHRRRTEHGARRRTLRLVLGVLTAANLGLGVGVLATGVPVSPVAAPAPVPVPGTAGALVPGR